MTVEHEPTFSIGLDEDLTMVLNSPPWRQWLSWHHRRLIAGPVQAIRAGGNLATAQAALGTATEERDRLAALWGQAEKKLGPDLAREIAPDLAQQLANAEAAVRVRTNELRQAEAMAHAHAAGTDRNRLAAIDDLRARQVATYAQRGLLLRGARLVSTDSHGDDVVTIIDATGIDRAVAGIYDDKFHHAAKRQGVIRHAAWDDPRLFPVDLHVIGLVEALPATIALHDELTRKAEVTV
jgi:hypothetical protein